MGATNRWLANWLAGWLAYIYLYCSNTHARAWTRTSDRLSVCMNNVHLWPMPSQFSAQYRDNSAHNCPSSSDASLYPRCLPLIHVMFDIVQPQAHLYGIAFATPMKNILHCYEIVCGCSFSRAARRTWTHFSAQLNRTRTINSRSNKSNDAAAEIKNLRFRATLEETHEKLKLCRS